MLSPETLSRLFRTDVPVAETAGRWYIQFGFAGFNSRANNGRGYATEASAVAAIRRLDPSMRNHSLGVIVAGDAGVELLGTDGPEVRQ